MSCSPLRQRSTNHHRPCPASHVATDPGTGLANAFALRRSVDVAPEARRTLEAFALRDPDGFLDPAILDGGPGGRQLGRVLSTCSAALRATPYRLSSAVFALAMAEPLPSAIVAGAVGDALMEGSIPLSATPWTRIVVPNDATTGSDVVMVAMSRLRARAAWDPCGPSRQIRDLVLRMAEIRGDRRARTRWSSLTGQVLGVGRALDLDPMELGVLVRAAELRDIGALALGATPGSRVLLEAGTLARAASDVLAAAPSLAPVARVLRACEERFDGSGAPDGLAGDDIPIQSRIIAACLALEQALGGTAFRSGLPPDEALRDVVRRAGTDFDPAVVRALEAVNPAASRRVRIRA